MVEDRMRRGSDAELRHDFRCGTLDGSTSDQRAYHDQGNAPSLEGASQCRNRQYRVDAQIGIGRADDDSLETVAGEGFDHARGGHGRGGAFVADGAYARCAAQLDEVFLKGEIARFGVEAGFHVRVAHREDARRQPETRPQVIGDLGEPGAPGKLEGAQEVKREVAVTQLEPCRSAERLHDAHHGPRLVAAPPSLRRVIDARERVEHGVNIRTDAKTQMREVVAGVHDQVQAMARQDSVQAQRQLRTPDAAAKRGDGHERPNPTARCTSLTTVLVAR